MSEPTGGGNQKPDPDQAQDQAQDQGQQPPAQPSPWVPQPTDPYGQPHPAHGQPDPAYGQEPHATVAPTESNVSATVLTIFSALSLCNFLTLGSLALGIIALAKSSTDPEGSRRLTRIGWIVFVVVWALMIASIVALIVFSRVYSRDLPAFDSRV
jgi:hypothetical protein